MPHPCAACQIVQSFKHIHSCLRSRSASVPGSSCRVRQRYLTVLSLATLRLYLKHRILPDMPRLRHATDFRLSEGTLKRPLKRDSTRFASSR